MIKLFLKYFVLTIVILSITLSPLGTARATDWFYSVKELALDIAARAVARVIYQRVSDAILEQLQISGRDGGAAFVRNWRNFIADAEHRGEDIFRSILSQTNLCDHIEQSVRQTYGANQVNQLISLLSQRIRINDLDPFSFRSNCTLPSNFSIQNYSQNFAANGGWQAFLRIAEPQNNFYGALILAEDELHRQRSVERSADISEATSGNGYTGRRNACQSDQGSFSSSRCSILGEITAPGRSFADIAENLLNKDLEWVTNADEISEALVAILTATINRTIDLATAPSNADSTDLEASNYEESLRHEYCSASRPSPGAVTRYGLIFYSYVQQQVGTSLERWGSLWADLQQCGNGTTRSGGLFGHSCGDGPCERARNEDNPYPYQRCVNACFRAIDAIPEEVSVAEPGEYVPPQPGNQPPSDSICTSPNASTADPSATAGYWCDNDPLGVSGQPTEYVLNCTGNPGNAFISTNLQNCNERPDLGTPGWSFDSNGRPLDFDGNPVDFLYEIACPGTLTVLLQPGNYSVGVWTEDPSTAVYACPAFASPGGP